MTALPAGVTVTYEAVADPDGSINKTSIGKSNFWDYSLVLFGVALPLDTGLPGTMMPGPTNTPQPMSWGAAGAPAYSFQALGVPITPIDDHGRTNSYPMFKLVARDAANNVLAQTSIVLPVSSELNCSVVPRIGNRAASGEAVSRLGLRPEPEARLSAQRLEAARSEGTCRTRPTSPRWRNSIIAAPACMTASCWMGNRSSARCVTSPRRSGRAARPNTPQLTTSIHSLHATVIDPNTGGTHGRFQQSQPVATSAIPVRPRDVCVARWARRFPRWMDRC